MKSLWYETGIQFAVQFCPKGDELKAPVELIVRDKTDLMIDVIGPDEVEMVAQIANDARAFINIYQAAGNLWVEHVPHTHIGEPGFENAPPCILDARCLDGENLFGATSMGLPIMGVDTRTRREDLPEGQIVSSAKDDVRSALLAKASKFAAMMRSPQEGVLLRRIRGLEWVFEDEGYGVGSSMALIVESGPQGPRPGREITTDGCDLTRRQQSALQCRQGCVRIIRPSAFLR